MLPVLRAETALTVLRTDSAGLAARGEVAWSGDSGTAGLVGQGRATGKSTPKCKHKGETPFCTPGEHHSCTILWEQPIKGDQLWILRYVARPLPPPANPPTNPGVVLKRSVAATLDPK